MSSIFLKSKLYLVVVVVGCLHGFSECAVIIRPPIH
ncbi:hypothetical protein [Vibrio phage vB_VpaP_C2]|nr:hypothetical protein [Vibrio phage vB_VpaP_C2]USL89969.1 hypothetical protein [Vibrio phage vB_VpaP_M3]